MVSANARELEEQGKYLEALRGYESAIEDRKLSDDQVVDALLLAFQMTDYGFVKSSRYSDDALEYGSRMMGTIIGYGERYLLDSADFQFWKSYTEAITMGDIIPAQFFESWLERGCSDAAIRAGNEKEKGKLRSKYFCGKTVRSLYVMSLLS